MHRVIAEVTMVTRISERSSGNSNATPWKHIAYADADNVDAKGAENGWMRHKDSVQRDARRHNTQWWGPGRSPPPSQIKPSAATMTWKWKEA